MCVCGFVHHNPHQFNAVLPFIILLDKTTHRQNYVGNTTFHKAIVKADQSVLILLEFLQ